MGSDNRQPIPRYSPEQTKARFWAKVQKSTGCWFWTASVDGSGYGQVNVAGKPKRAHRVAWSYTFGDIPLGLCVLHRCDNPRCVNPDHLFLGTMRDNTRDMMVKARDGHGRMPGQSNPVAKLTDADVRVIRQLRANGQKLRAIATRFGVTEANISYIAKGKGWKHVI